MKQIPGLVVKHNDLNAISYFKSSIQLKIFSKLITEVRENPNEEIYKLSIKQVLKDIEAHSKDYGKLKAVSKSMISKVIDIPQEKGFNLSVLFVNIKTDEKSFIGFKINPDLKPYILKLSKNFTCYFFENIAKLNSRFSIRIYELLKQFQNSQTQEGWLKITVEDLRKFIGIEEDKYKKYNHFKDRVILRSQEELKNKTDIKFLFKEKKEGKKVAVINFEILPNKKGKSIEAIDPKLSIEEQEHRKKYLNIILSLKDLPFLVTEDEELEILLNIAKTKELKEDELQNAIFAVQENIENDKIETSIFRQLKTSISQKWKPKVSFEDKKKKSNQKKLLSLKKSLNSLIKNNEKRKEYFDKFVFCKAEEKYKQLPKEEQKTKKEKYIQKLEEKINGAGGAMAETLRKMNETIAISSVIEKIKEEILKNQKEEFVKEFEEIKGFSFAEKEKEIKSAQEEINILEQQLILVQSQINT